MKRKKILIIFWVIIVLLSIFVWNYSKTNLVLEINQKQMWVLIIVLASLLMIYSITMGLIKRRFCRKIYLITSFKELEKAMIKYRLLFEYKGVEIPFPFEFQASKIALGFEGPIKDGIKGFLLFPKVALSDSCCTLTLHEMLIVYFRRKIKEISMNDLIFLKSMLKDTIFSNLFDKEFFERLELVSTKILLSDFHSNFKESITKIISKRLANKKSIILQYPHCFEKALEREKEQGKNDLELIIFDWSKDLSYDCLKKTCDVLEGYPLLASILFLELGKRIVDS